MALFTRPSDLAPALFESLEERMVLHSAPFLQDLPTLAMMENQANTVVRLQTSFGVIDIELYDVAGPGGASNAPITTANFLNYIRSGRYDQSFFHRLDDDFVLQGGGFNFVDSDAPPRYEAIDADPEIQNEFDAGRSNIERTIAMAKREGNPNSANSQFFFNIEDNVGLDGQNGGFTVFGRVIQGWNVILEINDLEIRDLNQFLAGGPNAFGEVPVTGAADTDLLFIEDIDVIKLANTTQFFTQTIYYPDGFRSGRIVSTVELVNHDPNASASYEIIARFETGSRDTVISSGTLVPGARLQVPISRGGDPSLNVVRGGTPFAYEVRSTGPIGATLNHRDFGATGAEVFFQPDTFATTQLTHWTFANGFKGPDNPSFLLWQNISGDEATVNILFYPDGGGAPFFISKTTDFSRRGGLNLNELEGLPDGEFSIQIISTQPIIASLSQYTASPGRASAETGVIAGGGTQGILPAAYIPTDGQVTLSFMFTGQAPSIVIVDLTFTLGDGSTVGGDGLVVLSPGLPRRHFSLADVVPALPRDEFFTIQYRVRNAAAPVSAAYTSTVLGDTVTTAFQNFATPEALFADGFTNPTDTGTEFISIYNPFTTGTTLSYRLRFHFTDSGEDVLITIPAATLDGGRRVDINVRDLAAVMDRIQVGEQFRHYSITVEGEFSDGSGTVPGAFVAQLTRFDQGNTVTTGPGFVAGANAIPMNDSRFQ